MRAEMADMLVKIDQHQSDGALSLPSIPTIELTPPAICEHAHIILGVSHHHHTGITTTPMFADPALIDFVSGSMAGFSCKVLEYPFDTVKTLLQCDREVGWASMHAYIHVVLVILVVMLRIRGLSLSLQRTIYKGALDCFGKVFRSNGVSGFYRVCVASYLSISMAQHNNRAFISPLFPGNADADVVGIHPIAHNTDRIIMHARGNEI